MNRFISVRCAILGYPRHKYITNELRYRINLELLERINNKEIQDDMAVFTKEWNSKHLNKLKKVKSQYKQERLNKRSDADYYNQFNVKFVNLLVKETLPNAKKPLMLRDGISIKI